MYSLIITHSEGGLLMCVRKRLRIGNYARVSYDEDKERYESIINQRNLNDDFIYDKF